MYTYLRTEELIQEGRELMWLATAFEGREAPAETRALYDAWIARARQALAGRAEPASGWQAAPHVGREMAQRADEVLELLLRLSGQ